MREEENKRSSKSEENSLNVKSLMRKRWLLPAVYLVAAAGVLSAVFIMQGQDESAAPPESVEVTDPSQAGNLYPQGEEAVPVTASSEVVKMPVVNDEEITVVGYFYDVNGTPEEQQEALVYYNNTYFPNKGMDFAHVDGESFEAAAALSGTVVKAEKDALLGYVVEISHENGVVTHYHSLETVEVEEGATVQQGDILGRAGRNSYNTDAGIHVHFEIRQDGVAVNPNDVFQQPIDSVKDIAKEKEAEKEAEKPADGEDKEDEGASDEEEVAPENHEDHGQGEDDDQQESSELG
ncbi:M23 family metallopeptidase [Halalkalibacter akibai]|uniref:Stage II sporulation protein related to metaloproteases n=1 Tax=Halalkalibacter akibai (strain ATCC 43226 / DSM 21942 / CIP 109018 / JCM 9157 / 1139) TaxID=1236973 RepID=W4QPR1_HALA3|nr:M23 family metallopeptidase [Halalkalibacter akibai]GAE33648.1 stage II sporulation protein related to metaloproteases [Halalkalibacter akibai JCM 9157]